MSWTRRLKAVLALAAFPACPVLAASNVILAVPEDASVIDIRPAAEMLVRNGAHATLEILPTGRINSVMKEDAPACRMEVIHDLAKHPTFQWVAKTASIDYVAAGLTEGAKHPPGPQTVAVVPMNTLAQGLASQAGYEILPVRSLSAAILLLQSGRASVIVATRQEVDTLGTAKNVPLHVETVMSHADIWLACNAQVESGDIQSIGDAWRKGITSGELRSFYTKAGIGSAYPEP